jgi:hypothetical protein
MSRRTGLWKTPDFVKLWFWCLYLLLSILPWKRLNRLLLRRRQQRGQREIFPERYG